MQTLKKGDNFTEKKLANPDHSDIVLLIKQCF